jgi:hypothetical protein
LKRVLQLAEKLTNASSTVEERRFSAARGKIRAGFSPWSIFVKSALKGRGFSHAVNGLKQSGL